MSEKPNDRLKYSAVGLQQVYQQMFGQICSTIKKLRPIILLAFSCIDDTYIHFCNED